MKLFGIHIDTALEKAGNESDARSKQTTSATSVTTDLGGIKLTLGLGATGSLDQPCKPGRFYVYVHKDAQGRVFYVGKGTGNRAYSNDRGPEHQAYVEKFCGAKFDVEVIRKDISEDDALELEDLLMQQHGATIINRQNFHAPHDSNKLFAYSDAMKACGQLRNEAEIFALEGKIDAAILAYEKAYAKYLTARQNSDYNTGERAKLSIPFLPPTALADRYSKLLAKAGRHAELVSFVERFESDWQPPATDKRFIALQRRAKGLATGKQEKGSASMAPFSPPQSLPADWEWAKEQEQNVVRLLRGPDRAHLDFVDTVEPVKEFRRARKFSEAVALMKQAITSAEAWAQREKMPPPPFYYMEAAKSCRDLGDLLQECLFLHRYNVLAQRAGRPNADFIKRLAKVSAMLASTKGA